jgi:acyl carrier protein
VSAAGAQATPAHGQLILGKIKMSIRSTILAQVVEVARQQKKQLPPLSDNLPLLESGLDSLCIAVLVASLDDLLQIDPFSDDANFSLPVTLGEFIALYENAVTANA